MPCSLGELVVRSEGTLLAGRPSGRGRCFLSRLDSDDADFRRLVTVARLGDFSGELAESELEPEDDEELEVLLELESLSDML